MQLYRNGGLNARIAFNAMSGYDINRVIPETQNALGFLGDDMFKYLGPGEDVMATDPQYADVMRWSASKRLSVETRREHRRDPERVRGSRPVYDVGKLKWRARATGSRATNSSRGRRRSGRLGPADRSRAGRAAPRLQDDEGEQRTDVPDDGRDERRSVAAVPEPLLRHHRPDASPGRRACRPRSG